MKSLVDKLTKKNVGPTDRVIRALPFLAFLFLLATDRLTGVPLIALGVVSSMALFTAVTSRCTIYAMLGLNTTTGRAGG